MGRCTGCGTETGFMVSTCDACLAKERARQREQALARAESAKAEQSADAQAERRRQSAEFAEEARRILVTTAPTLPGRRIVETLDVITGECVFGINMFRDLLVGLTDVFGGRSETTQKALRDARKVCLHDLRAEAAALGGNAVIAVSFSYNALGHNESIIMMVASGTAVRVEPLAPGAEPD